MPPFNIPFAFWAAAAAGGGSAPALVEAVSNVINDSGSNASCSVTFASSVTAGQYIILIALSGTQSANVLNTPSGFTKLFGDDSAYGVFAKKAVGNEGTSFSVTNFQIGGILVGLKISGAGSTPLDVSGQVTETLTGGSITTTAANDLLFSIFFGQAHATSGSPAVPTAPAGWTTITVPDSLRVTSAHGGPLTMGVAYKTQATAGASGTQVWTSAGVASWIVTLAVTPT